MMTLVLVGNLGDIGGAWREECWAIGKEVTRVMEQDKIR